MPTSQAGRRTNPAPGRATAGFTLIELLVVVAIVSILSVGVGLTAGGAFRAGTDPAAQLAATVERARDRALLGQRLIGIEPRADGWQLRQRDAQGLWQDLGAAERTRGLTVGWQIAGRAAPARLTPPGTGQPPPILFAPDGGSTPFTAVLVTGAGRRACAAPAAGALTCG